MSNGIYLYYDTKENSVVYVGRDSNIDKKTRHKAHMQKSNYDDQPFNRILQNNPDRYKYRVYYEGVFSNEELNDLESQTIKLFNTFHRKDAFNYTKGGEGTLGRKHTEEEKNKISKAISGENNPMYGKKGENHPAYGTKRSEETRKKMSEANSGRNHPQWKDYARVVKKGTTHSGKKRYALRYDGKDITSSIYKEKLEKLADEINKNKNHYISLPPQS